MAHDIFVSYAHADDEPPGQAKYGGVTTFVEQLKLALRKKMGGQGASVWMDHLLAANDRVTETLEAQVKASKAILLFMSPGYLMSPWCKLEIDRFLERNAGQFNRENVFVVAVEETDRTLWPERVQALTPLELFEKDLKGVTRTLGWPYPPSEPESPYWQRVNELAHLIRKQFASVAAPPTPPPQPAPGPVGTPTGAAPTPALSPVVPPATPAAPRVWIAQTTPELREQWESLACAVRQAGATVLPAGPAVYPEGDPKAYRRVVTLDLLDSDLLVQLLGADAGPLLGGAGQDRPALLQNELARLMNAPGHAAMMRWRAAEARVDEEQSASDDYQRLLLGAVAGPFEQFRGLVVAEIERRLRPPPPPAPPQMTGAAPVGGLTVCVTAAERDGALARNVCQVVGTLGAVPIDFKPKPSAGQSQTEYREDFEQLLESVDGVIMVHGTAPASWLHSRHAQVRKSFAMRSTGIWGAFIDGPPTDKIETVDCADPGVLTLLCRDGILPPSIERFLQQLRAG